MSISRQKFYSWLTSYALYTTGLQPEEGRDSIGKWIIIKPR
jgi:hypothetical protein